MIAFLLAGTAPALLFWRRWTCRVGSSGLAQCSHTKPRVPWQPTPSILAAWESVEARKAALPKDPTYQQMTEGELAKSLPIWVLSLKRATERREAVAKHLKDMNISTYELLDGVDGKDPSAVTYEEASKHLWGKILRMWVKGNEYARVRLAGDLSHYRAMERSATTNVTALILEDDATVAPNFYRDLLLALRELPNDWSVLYLNGCYHVVGRKISPHLAVFRAGACIWGYVVTPEFSRAVLKYVEIPQPGGYQVTDLIFDQMIQDHKVHAYIAQPPLVGMSAAKSLMPAFEPPQDQKFNFWDKIWLFWHGNRKLLL